MGDVLVMGTLLSQFKFLCGNLLPKRGCSFRMHLTRRKVFFFFHLMPLVPKPKRQKGLQKSAGG